MLTPDQMDAAGEEVAAVYRQIEAELIDYLVQRMIEGDVSGQRAGTALSLLAQSDPEQLRRIIDAHAEEIDDAARRDVERSLAASDAFDLAAIAAGMAVSAPREALTAQTVAVMSSVRGMIARDNLEMTNAARTKFLQWSTWAATQTATGNMTADKAMRRAVRELARGGLSIESVTYRDPESGKVTVTNKADVAVQRHIRSLIGQGAAALTFERMRENGVEFVEVSSHIGSRPSHAEWQGRCYHVGGAVEVDGVRFEDFAFGTGYGGECGPYAALGDQLMGVNCRHSFAPWVPGAPRAYSPDPESPTGLPNEEIYELTQGQRARERKIREAKRELAAMQRVYDSDPTPENAAELAKSKALLRNRQERMRAYIAEANARCKPGTKVLKRMPSREWAGDMPKGASSPSARIVNEAERPSKGRQLTRTPAVDFDRIDSPEYRRAFECFDDKELGDLVCHTAKEMLRHRSGTVMEDFAAISVSSKTVTAKTTTATSRKGAPLSRGAINAIEAAKRGDLVSLHNHPESMPPSASDFLLLRHRSFRYGIIACHNGRVIRYRISDADKFNEVVASGRHGDIDSFLSRNLVYYESSKGSKALATALERRYGVTYEELA